MPNELNTAQDSSDSLESLISQLSPQELEQLAAELAQDMQNPETSGGEIQELAQAIQSHLDSNPAASLSPGEAPAAKVAAVNFMKSAEYIEGFLNEAVDCGANIKQAVDLYDQALTDTILQAKKAELRGNQSKLDVDNDGKIESSDLAALRHRGKESKKQEKAETSKHEKSETKEQEKKEHMKTSMEQVKLAAYVEGFVKRAAEYGLHEYQAVQLLKQAAPEDFLGALVRPDADIAALMEKYKAPYSLTDAANFISSMNDKALDEGLGLASGARNLNIGDAGPAAESFFAGNKSMDIGGGLPLLEKIKYFLKDHGKSLGYGAAGLGAGALGAAALSGNKKEKKADFGINSVGNVDLGSGVSSNPIDLLNQGHGVSDINEIVHSLDGSAAPNPASFLRGNLDLSLDPNQKRSLAEKVMRFLELNKTPLGIGAAGLGAGALGVHALKNRKNRDEE